MQSHREPTDKPVVVAGNDVDLLVLLIGLTPIDSNIDFYKIVSTGKKEKKLYSTRDNRHLQPFILFAHAYAGCDTTSAFYNKGKNSIISLLQKDQTLCDSASAFYAANKTIDELYDIGENILKHLYVTSNEATLSLNDIRYKLFTASVAGAKKDILPSLPPTRGALLEHIKRVYYQVQQWKSNKLDSLQWGWEKLEGENFILIPKKTSLLAAPPELLSKISCNCASSRSTTKRCTCTCNPLCKKCPNEDECSNLPVQETNETQEEIDSEGGEEEENGVYDEQEGFEERDGEKSQEKNGDYDADDEEFEYGFDYY
ncbi:uncharacterized protein LOC107042937 [Diachasma alloeum]|uniref:uncharacterized protein LOC107042937 n=1 Tax=Diachasma alloeum TaxID=454923 RepID=UPI0007383575|nr:uncharacterized protein LOC107042937 [Diachasma alloeum]